MGYPGIYLTILWGYPDIYSSIPRVPGYLPHYTLGLPGNLPEYTLGVPGYTLECTLEYPDIYPSMAKTTSGTRVNQSIYRTDHILGNM